MITIEGLSGAGKTTAGQALATRHGIPCINTGSLYRGAAAASLLDGIDERELSDYLAGADIALDLSDPLNPLVSVGGVDGSEILQAPEVTNRATKVGGITIAVAKFEPIYAQLTKLPNVIFEGKGLSTGVGKNADHKFYLTASRFARAHRKCEQAHKNGFLNYTPQEALLKLVENEERDLANSRGLLTKSADAIEINTTIRTPEAVVKAIEKAVGLA